MADLQISGAVVTALPDRFDEVRQQLAAHSGIDVHETEAATGRLVITIEAASIEAAQRRFREVQNLDGVAHAELVMHHTGG